MKHTLTSVEKRKRRVRAKVQGTPVRPRVTVFRSNRSVYLQAIDDASGKTLASASDIVVRREKKAEGTKSQSAAQAAEVLANKLQEQKITAVVIDRGAYKYHGRVKAVAEALRAKGVEV